MQRSGVNVLMQSMAIGDPGFHLLIVQDPVERESRSELVLVTIHQPPMVEHLVQDLHKRIDIAIHNDAQMTVAGERGARMVSALKHAVWDSRLEPENATIQLLSLVDES